MQQAKPFLPNNTVSISATTSSGSIALSGGGHIVRIAATEDVYINFGTSGVTAAVATGMLILADTPEVFTLKGSVTHVAAITETGTARVNFTRGEGE